MNGFIVQQHLIERYSRNLAALEEAFPGIAGVVRAAPFPPDVSLATGRDGSETFLVNARSNEPQWLGRTSMPRVSAEEMFTNVQAEAGNVVLPGILSGAEVVEIARRLPRHRAVFVIEEDAGLLKLAMHLYDYSELTCGGRVVFILGTDSSAAFQAFFQGHPGYFFPSTFLTVPQRTRPQAGDLQRRLESIGTAVLEIQARFINEKAQSIRLRYSSENGASSIPAPTLSAGPRVLFAATTTARTTIDAASRLARAAEMLGWPHALCVPDTPDRCHVAAHLKAIEEIQAQIVIMVNGLPGDLRGLLPDLLPVVSWMFPGAPATPTRSFTIAPFDLCLVSSTAQQAELARCGTPCHAIERCSVSADAGAFHPMPQLSGEDRSFIPDVVVVGDLPDDRPEAADVTLPSQVTLWNALKELIAADPDKYRNENANKIFEEAQRISGVLIRDPSLHNTFLGWFQSRIAPATVAQRMALSLKDSKIDLAVWGQNWRALKDQTGLWRGPIPDSADLNRIFNLAGWIVLPIFSDASVQLALDALCAGANVACRAGNLSLAQEDPALADVAAHVHFFRSRTELLRLLHRDVRATDQMVGGISPRDVILSHHALSHRLVALVEHLAKKMTAFCEAPALAL